MNISRNLSELFRYTDTLGWVNGTANFAKTKLKGDQKISLTKIQYPIYLRGGTSDINAFRQVFILKEYDFHIDGSPDFIIDGGSNIGLAAIYFANKYPKATIVSIEPETSNFKQLKLNTSNYTNINPIQSGIWSHSTFLKVRDLGLGNWGFVVEEQSFEDKDTFKAISIIDIMKQFNKDKIDIVKLDIEGAEKEVFSKNFEEWLPKTKVLIVELHDRMKRDCSKVFFNAVEDQGFIIEQLGENLICYRS